MAITLYNGFPLIGAGTAAYIEEAVHPYLPPDNTPFYGLFVRIASLKNSLWFVPVAQSLLIAFLLLKYISLISRKYIDGTVSANVSNSLFGNPRSFEFTLVTVVVIVSFTCVGWVTGFIMPDIFAGALLLSMLLFMSEEPGRPGSLAAYSLLILVSMAMDNSHFLAAALFSTTLLIVSLVRKQANLVKKSAMLVGLCVVCWGVVCTMNMVKKHGFVYSRGGNIVMVAKLAEDGILTQYLSENCDKRTSKLCEYRTNIPPNITQFLTGESPVYKMGGWDSCHAAYAEVVHEVFTTPRYAGMFAQKTVIATLKALVQVNAPGKFLIQGMESETSKKIRDYFIDELREFASSFQNTQALSTGSFNFIYYLFFVLSCIWILMNYPKVMNRQLLVVYCYILAFFIANAVVTAVFYEIVSRFQYRVFWILPATNAIVIINHYQALYLKQQEKKQGVK